MGARRSILRSEGLLSKGKANLEFKRRNGIKNRGVKKRAKKERK